MFSEWYCSILSLGQNVDENNLFLIGCRSSWFKICFWSSVYIYIYRTIFLLLIGNSLIYSCSATICFGNKDWSNILSLTKFC